MADEAPRSSTGMEKLRRILECAVLFKLVPTRSDIGVIIRDAMGKEEGWLQYLPAADAILDYWTIVQKNAMLLHSRDIAQGSQDDGKWSLHKQPKDQIADHEYSIWLDDDPVIMANTIYTDGEKHLQAAVDALNGVAYTAKEPDDDCACGGGDVSGHDTACPYYSLPSTPSGDAA